VGAAVAGQDDPGHRGYPENGAAVPARRRGHQIRVRARVRSTILYLLEIVFVHVRRRR
jgi:hypothetical protein